MTNQSFVTESKVAKVDETLGLVFGWAIVCKDGGEPYFDLQGDHIPEESMLKASADFMENSRVAGEGHEKAVGQVVFAMPMTAEVAEAYGVTTQKTGLMIAMRPEESVFEKFRSGELTGFSIGGERGQDEVVADA